MTSLSDAPPKRLTSGPSAAAPSPTPIIDPAQIGSADASDRGPRASAAPAATAATESAA
jgi:hypothetical protein